MLYLIGLGLGDAKDITLRGLEIVKKANKVYLENYTSLLCCEQDDLEALYGRQVILVDRDMMEQGCKDILDTAAAGDAAVLVVGDPLNATTHTDLLIRATGQNIPYKIIHNASILNAVACCGLQIYNFGETVSIPFWAETWKPDSFYDKIIRNRANGLHTLCLLDIKVKEPNLELMVKGVSEMDPPRFMTVSQAAQQLLSIIKSRKLNRTDAQGNEITDSKEVELNEDTICIGLARIGSSTQSLIKTSLTKAADIDFGPPLHSIAIPGKMHPLEEEMINLFVQ